MLLRWSRIEGSGTMEDSPVSLTDSKGHPLVLALHGEMVMTAQRIPGEMVCDVNLLQANLSYHSGLLGSL